MPCTINPPLPTGNPPPPRDPLLLHLLLVALKMDIISVASRVTQIQRNRVSRLRDHQWNQPWLNEWQLEMACSTLQKSTDIANSLIALVNNTNQFLSSYQPDDSLSPIPSPTLRIWQMKECKRSFSHAWTTQTMVTSLNTQLPLSSWMTRRSDSSWRTASSMPSTTASSPLSYSPATSKEYGKYLRKGASRSLSASGPSYHLKDQLRKIENAMTPGLTQTSFPLASKPSLNL